MYYKNFIHRFLLRKNLFKRIGMRLGIVKRKLTKNEFDDLVFLYRLVGEKPSAIFDCGANVGFVSYQFYKCFPEAFIYAFEPNPDVFKKLSTNLEKENLRIIPVQAGIGDQQDTITFYKNNNTGTSSFLKPTEFHMAHMAKKYSPISVPVITIQSYCAEKGIPKISILKLDIEGFEIRALEGCKSLLEQQSIDFLFIEVSMIPFYINQPLLEDVIIYLRKLNYVPYNFYGNNETELRESLITNILFMSQKMARKISSIKGDNSVYVPM